MGWRHIGDTVSLNVIESMTYFAKFVSGVVFARLRNTMTFASWAGCSTLSKG